MEKLRRLFSLCVFSLLQFCNDSSVAESRDRTLIKSHARSIRKDFYQENTSALNKTKKTGITSVHILVIYYPTSNNFARDISTANVASREIYFKKKKEKEHVHSTQKRFFSRNIHVSNSLDSSRSIDLAKSKLLAEKLSFA